MIQTVSTGVVLLLLLGVILNVLSFIKKFMTAIIGTIIILAILSSGTGFINHFGEGNGPLMENILGTQANGILQNVAEFVNQVAGLFF